MGMIYEIYSIYDKFIKKMFFKKINLFILNEVIIFWLDIVGFFCIIKYFILLEMVNLVFYFIKLFDE